MSGSVYVGTNLNVLGNLFVGGISLTSFVNKVFQNGFLNYNKSE